MVREPLLTTVAIIDLRPTQITVGMREVEAKRKHWKELRARNGGEFLGKHMIPVILGPKHRHYVIDHHHLALALHDEKVRDVAVTVIANLSKLEPDAFWIVMDNRNWMHPFGTDGHRRHYKDLPKPSLASSTIRSARWPANCAAPAVSPRTRRRMPNSFGRISCAGASSASWWSRISTGRWNERCNWAGAWMPTTCPAGAALRPRGDP